MLYAITFFFTFINEFTQIYNEEQEGKDIQTEADTMIIPEPTAWKTLLKEE